MSKSSDKRFLGWFMLIYSILLLTVIHLHPVFTNHPEIKYDCIIQQIFDYINSVLTYWS